MDRALTILMCFRDAESWMTLSELSERTGFYKSTLLRLIASLERFGFIQRNEDKSYGLGWALGQLGGLYRRSISLEQQIRPILRELRNSTGESASFYRREGNMRTCLFREESRHMIRDHVDEGAVLPLHLGAAGHVLSRSSAGNKLDLTLTTSLGERDPEVAAMAVPVFDDKQELVGALTISGPILRLSSDRMEEFAPWLLRAGAELSRAFGAELVCTDTINDN